MEQLFNTEIKKNLNMSETLSSRLCCRNDFNQTHFVRNKEFKEAADKLEGPLRQIFVEFLERSCTAEFSGFLPYKELERRLKVLATILISISEFLAHQMVYKGREIPEICTPIIVHSKYLNLLAIYFHFQGQKLEKFHASMVYI